MVSAIDSDDSDDGDDGDRISCGGGRDSRGEGPSVTTRSLASSPQSWSGRNPGSAL